MNKEQAFKEFMKLLDEKIKEEDDLIRKAKDDGIWKPGLDSNKELFAAVEGKYLAKFRELIARIDEE